MIWFTNLTHGGGLTKCEIHLRTAHNTQIKFQVSTNTTLLLVERPKDQIVKYFWSFESKPLNEILFIAKMYIGTPT